MRLIFINRFFYPDHSATSQMLSDLAFALAARGHDVHVIASRQIYDRPSEELAASETVDKVSIHRIWTTRFGRQALAGRAIDYVTFYLAVIWAVWRLARSGDIVVAKTDPPMLSVAVAAVVRLRGARLVNWLQDVFPEVAQLLGVGSGPLMRWLYRPLTWLRNRSLHKATMNVAIGDLMAERLHANGVPRARIRVIPNWADGALIKPVAPDHNPLRTEWGLADAFVVGYSGNLGRAHEFATLLDAISRLEARSPTPRTDVAQSPQPAPLAPAASLPSRPRVIWLFIGGGAMLEQLRVATRSRNLDSVVFKPYQPREALAQSLSVADVHIVMLRPELEGLIVPSKYYGIAAAGRAAVFIGAADGEIPRLLANANAGATVAEGDGEALAALIAKMADDPRTCAGMGASARRMFDERFDKSVAVSAWEGLIRDIRQ